MMEWWCIGNITFPCLFFQYTNGQMQNEHCILYNPSGSSSIYLFLPQWTKQVDNTLWSCCGKLFWGTKSSVGKSFVYPSHQTANQYMTQNLLASLNYLTLTGPYYSEQSMMFVTLMRFAPFSIRALSQKSTVHMTYGSVIGEVDTSHLTNLRQEGGEHNPPQLHAKLSHRLNGWDCSKCIH